MSRYRDALPQLAGELFLTDGGIETSLIFHEGLHLPHFAAFHLLKSEAGVRALRAYFTRYCDVAMRRATGLILESPTWRASADWGAKLGYTPDAVDEANRRAIRLLESIRAGYGDGIRDVVLSGCVGPRGDGYVIDEAMTPEEALAYHRRQVEVFAGSAADMICAMTMTHAEEAIGIARAARGVDMPVAISFTVETDGRLPDGQSLRAAIERVDAETDGYPAYYMINCAHPTHFEHLLDGGGAWLDRLGGLRANASCRSHAELNESTALDEGNPSELALQYAVLKARLPRVTVLGGCCGTDHRHVEQIASACLPQFRRNVVV